MRVFRLVVVSCSLALNTGAFAQAALKGEIWIPAHAPTCDHATASQPSAQASRDTGDGGVDHGCAEQLSVTHTIATGPHSEQSDAPPKQLYDIPRINSFIAAFHEARSDNPPDSTARMVSCAHLQDDIGWRRPICYGADPTGLTDSTAAFSAMFAATGSGGGTIFIGNDIYYVGNLTIPANVSLECGQSYGDPGIIHRSGIFSNPYRWGGQIRTRAGTTITGSNGGRISKCLIIHENLPLPATNATTAAAVKAAFADTAISLDGASFELDHVAVFGYETALRSTNSGGHNLSNRVRVIHSLFDNSNGLNIGSSGDPNDVVGNHFFPFLTMLDSAASADQRSGTAVLLSNQDTSTRINSNLAFGYENCIVVAAGSAIDVFHNHCENFAGGGAIGLALNGQYLRASHNVILGFAAAAQLDAAGYSVGNDTNTLDHNTIIAATTCINLKAGYGIITGNILQGCATGLKTESGATGGIISDNRFVSTTTPWSNNSLASASAFVFGPNDGLSPWQTWTPVFFGVRGDGLAVTTNNAKFYSLNGETKINLNFTITRAGSAVGAVRVGKLPVTPSSQSLISCGETSVNGGVGLMRINKSSIYADIWFLNSASSAIAGAVWQCNGSYN